LDSYESYAVGTRKNGTIYMLQEVKIPRCWTTSPDDAMLFFTKEEVEFVIQKFNVPNAYVAIIKMACS